MRGLAGQLAGLHRLRGNEHSVAGGRVRRYRPGLRRLAERHPNVWRAGEFQAKHFQ
ncbi:hypothetical protein EMIT0324P_11129 [Pseudomonas chlororaphis]